MKLTKKRRIGGLGEIAKGLAEAIVRGTPEPLRAAACAGTFYVMGLRWFNDATKRRKAIEDEIERLAELLRVTREEQDQALAYTTEKAKEYAGELHKLRVARARAERLQQAREECARWQRVLSGEIDIGEIDPDDMW